ncbi:MAG: ABC transporter ATP-binding protein [Lachnospiraceae bacterium]|nr:ABC transporter ATP-binding protein [Lachnospiraceae bacterium]
MEEAIRLEHVEKRYRGFALKDVNLTLPKGSIMGLIGENGAGKSTILKAALGLIHKDAGNVFLFGREFDGSDSSLKEQIGVVMDTLSFSGELTLKNINRIMKEIYRNWEEDTFLHYQEVFELSGNKKVRELSRGMRMKLSLAAALSHRAKLLVLDECTSGLDPISRDELLDVFLDFIQDEANSILISSHILSDLEKICDYITFIHKGEVCFSKRKDLLLDSYGVFHGTKAAIREMDSAAVIGVRENAFGADALVLRKRAPLGLPLDPADIETIMLYYVRGGGKR